MTPRKVLCCSPGLSTSACSRATPGRPRPLASDAARSHQMGPVPSSGRPEPSARTHSNQGDLAQGVQPNPRLGGQGRTYTRASVAALPMVRNPAGEHGARARRTGRGAQWAGTLLRGRRGWPLRLWASRPHPTPLASTAEARPQWVPVGQNRAPFDTPTPHSPPAPPVGTQASASLLWGVEGARQLRPEVAPMCGLVCARAHLGTQQPRPWAGGPWKGSLMRGPTRPLSHDPPVTCRPWPTLGPLPGAAPGGTPHTQAPSLQPSSCPCYWPGGLASAEAHRSPPSPIQSMKQTRCLGRCPLCHRPYRSLPGRQHTRFGSRVPSHLWQVPQGRPWHSWGPPLTLAQGTLWTTAPTNDSAMAPCSGQQGPACAHRASPHCTAMAWVWL